MSKRMEEALRKIVDARDYHANNAEYPLPPNGPDQNTQCFDDWAADVAAEALKQEASPLEEYVCQECGSADVEVAMWVNPNTSQTNDWYGSGSSTETQWCHSCEEHCFVELKTYKQTNEAMDKLSEDMNPVVPCPDCGATTGVCDPNLFASATQGDE